MDLTIVVIMVTSILLSIVAFGFFYLWTSIRAIRRDLELPPLRDKMAPLDLTPRLLKNAPKIKPKYRSDFDLFEREKNHN